MDKSEHDAAVDRIMELMDGIDQEEFRKRFKKKPAPEAPEEDPDDNEYFSIPDWE